MRFSCNNVKKLPSTLFPFRLAVRTAKKRPRKDILSDLRPPVDRIQVVKITFGNSATAQTIRSTFANHFGKEPLRFGFKSNPFGLSSIVT
ncbi:MAG: hypothetical protein CMO44_02575 [Verrucomicrobiales bacterium]|nr:hypothetical protein [Verrucomicrobiales bacterium]